MIFSGEKESEKRRRACRATSTGPCTFPAFFACSAGEDREREEEGEEEDDEEEGDKEDEEEEKEGDFYLGMPSHT